MTDEWMREHKGKRLKTVGMVWQCDDDCGCSEAQVVTYYQNKVVPQARVPVVEWSGTFYTEYESGADVDLAEYRRSLSPDSEAAIEWQVGVDYSKRRQAPATP